MHRIEGDPLGTERAISSLRYPEKVRNLEILTQYDPWSDVFGPIPGDFLEIRCYHDASQKKRSRCLEAGSPITVPCRHRFDFTWSFLAGFRNLHHINLQGLSGSYVQVVSTLIDLIITSPHLESLGLGESMTGFAQGLGSTLMRLRYCITRSLEEHYPGRAFWEAGPQPMKNVRILTLGQKYIPGDYNEWDSIDEGGDLGLALSWLLPCYGGSDMDGLTVHNTVFDTELADQATGLVWVKGRAYPMTDNPYVSVFPRTPDGG